MIQSASSLLSLSTLLTPHEHSPRSVVLVMYRSSLPLAWPGPHVPTTSRLRCQKAGPGGEHDLPRRSGNSFVLPVRQTFDTQGSSHDGTSIRSAAILLGKLNTD